MAGAVGQPLEIVFSLGQRFAVDSHQPLTRLDPEVRARQWRGPIGPGEIAAADFLDLPEAGFRIVAQIGAEQTGADLFARANVASAMVGVADVEFAEHLAQAISQVPARADAVS